MPFGASSFSECLRWGTEIYHALKSVLVGHGYTALVGDEGGYAPALKSNAEAVEVILEAIEKAGYNPAKKLPSLSIRLPQNSTTLMKNFTTSALRIKN